MIGQQVEVSLIDSKGKRVVLMNYVPYEEALEYAKLYWTVKFPDKEMHVWHENNDSFINRYIVEYPHGGKIPEKYISGDHLQYLSIQKIL